MSFQRRVVCAANRYGSTLILGPRHFSPTMHAQIAQLPKNPAPFPGAWEQGFIDQYGVFMTREEAWVVARDANQIIRRVGGDEGCLYSENIC